MFRRFLITTTLSRKPASCFRCSLAPLSCYFHSEYDAGIMGIVAQLAQRKSETCELGGRGRSSPRWLWSSLWCGRTQQSELLGQRDSLGGGCSLISVTSKQVFFLSQFSILSSLYSFTIPLTYWLVHSPSVSHRLSQDSHTVATMTSGLMDVSETFLWDVHIMLICHFSLCLALLFFSWFTHTLKTFSSSLGRIISWHLFCCSQYYWNSYEMLSHTYLAVFKTTYQITKCGSNKTQTVMWN